MIIYKLKKLVFFLKNWYRFKNLSSSKKEDIQDLQKEKLKVILKCAIENVPYYSFLKDKINFNDFTFDELKKFPIINKDKIIENPSLFVNINNKNSEIIKKQTSGSSGKPFEFLQNINIEIIEVMTYFRFWYNNSNHEYKPFKPIIFLRSYSPKEGESLYKRFNLFNIWYLSAFHINEINLKFYIKIIEKSKAKVIHGYPSALYIFTLLLKKYNIKISQIKLITCSSETVLPIYREAIEDWWGNIFSDSYGLAENGALIQQCKYNKYHNNEDFGYVELNEQNQIIITSLNNTIMPFIRYNTKDRAIIKENQAQPCQCGSSFSIPFQGIEGRDDDMLIKKDGTIVPTANFSTAMKNFKKLKQFQIIQHEDISVTLNLVIENFNNEYINSIKKEVIRRLGDVEIEINIVEFLERDIQTGKVKVTIQKSKII